MDLKTTLESLFETDITDICEVGDLDDTQESPALVACEAARGVLETFDEEPQHIAEAADGFLVSGDRSAILIGHDGAVIAKSLDVEEDDEDLEIEEDDEDLEIEEDDPDEATTSGLVGGFRGGGAAKTPMMGKYGRKNAKKKGGLKMEDVDEDDREELFEELLSEHVRLQTDYGTVSLKVDPYSVVRYPTDDKMDMDERDAMRSKVDDALLKAVLAAKPVFETALKKALRADPDIKQYGVKIKEDDETIHLFLLQEFAEQLVVNATKAGVLNEAKDLLPVLDSAIDEDDIERTGDVLKQMCEAFGVDEKLIPTPSAGKHPMPPYTPNPYGSKPAGRVSQLKGRSVGMEDIEDMDEDEVLEAGLYFMGGKVSGNPMGGALQDNPDKLKPMMTALHKRRLELLGKGGNDTLPAMRLEHEDGKWFIAGLWETDDPTEAATAAHALDIEIDEAPEIEPEGDPVYEFTFPRARIKEFVSLAAKAGAEADAQIAVHGEGFKAFLPESVATKVRPFFKGDDVQINEVEGRAAELVLAG